MLCLVWTRVEYLVKDNLPNHEDIIKNGKFYFPPCLIICPASLAMHWLSEIEQHFAQNTFLKAKIFEGKEEVEWNFHVFRIIIVSYEMLRKHKSKFHAVVWDITIVDEAHLIRNPNAAIAKAIFGLSTRHRLALTGTPIQNKVNLNHYLSKQ